MKDSLDMRYAEALYSLALSEKKTSLYQKEIKEVKNVLDDNQELLNLLNSAFISKDNRYQVIDKVFKGYQENVTNFLKVLVNNHRLNHYRGIFMTFNSLINEHNNVKEGIIYSTEPLNESKINEIENALYEAKGSKVELINRIDASLIGGIKVIIDNHVYDYSIQNELDHMRQKL